MYCGFCTCICICSKPNGVLVTCCFTRYRVMDHVQTLAAGTTRVLSTFPSTWRMSVCRWDASLCPSLHCGRGKGLRHRGHPSSSRGPLSHAFSLLALPQWQLQEDVGVENWSEDTLEGWIPRQLHKQLGLGVASSCQHRLRKDISLGNLARKKSSENELRNLDILEK